MKLNCSLLVAITLLATTSVFAQSRTDKNPENPQRIIDVDYEVENGTMNTLFKQ